MQEVGVGQPDHFTVCLIIAPNTYIAGKETRYAFNLRKLGFERGHKRVGHAVAFVWCTIPAS